MSILIISPADVDMALTNIEATLKQRRDNVTSKLK